MAKQKTHEQFMSEFKKCGNKNVMILGRYVNSTTKILVKCKIDGYEWNMLPGNLLRGKGCPVCTGQKVIGDINSVAVRRPDLIKYFTNQRDAYGITPYSKKKVSLTCPDCGTVRTMLMYDLSAQGFNCTECNDNISYPNRCIRSIMRYFKGKVDYLEYEWSAEWSNKTRYDVYFEKDTCRYIIEMHGAQHYIGGWTNGKSLEETVRIDREKERRAIEHQIVPIIIDARYSNFDFIFSNIKNSLLNSLFDLSAINILQCEEEIASNLVKQVCTEYENSPNIRIKDLVCEFNLCKETIQKYLQIGSKIGWCEYTPGILTQTKVNLFDSDKNFIKSYSSMADCTRQLFNTYNVKIRSSDISRACQKGYKCCGFYFEYA